MTDMKPCICATCGKSGECPSYLKVAYCEDCLAKLAAERGVAVTHCKCGAIGIEERHDPAPGICPACFALIIKQTVALEVSNG